MHAFVDESERNGTYLMCAVLVDPPHLGSVRRALTALCLPGQRRIHLTKERPPRRRLILSTLATLPIASTVVVSNGGVLRARKRCLDWLVPDLAVRGASRLVLEPVASLVAFDRGVVYEALRHGGHLNQLAVEHVEAKHEQVLWAADALAWAFGAGGDWRRRTAKVIDRYEDTRR